MRFVDILDPILLTFCTTAFAAQELPPRDACGPKVQGANTPLDTCNTTIKQVTTPQTYGAMLLNDESGLNVTWQDCLPSILDVCDKLTNPQTPVGAWNWTDPGSGCVMGFWLPQYNGSARVPTLDTCWNNIYTPMYEIGRFTGGQNYNQVVVNLAVLPNNFQTGQAVNVGYPSYTISFLPMISTPAITTPATKD